ncbi:MAG: cob(I)yrinic acid a,c-diamide adenosyltransferase [Oscillospiraceae bacterium]|nr:cob(I)yrinic acid a,c-diamide adenosyltransferase [Oscillospiraceae bacterium]
MIHLYCGDGKGKTTAAIGLAVRAAGAGYPVVVAQFCKTMPTGELISLEKLHIPVLRVKDEYGFSWQLTDEQKAALATAHERLLADAAARCDAHTVLVLDELVGTLHGGLIGEDSVFAALARCPAMDIVLTGRCPSERLLAMADYITEMKCIRHPMEKGISARKGIEF